MTALYADPERLEAFRRRIEDVLERSAFYRRSFREASFSPSDLATWDDIAAVPFLTKEAATADQQQSPPYGSQLASDPAAVRRLYCSGGSLYLFFDDADLERGADVFARQWATLGVRAGDVVDICSSYHWVIGGTLMDAAARRLGAAVVPGGPGQTEYRVRVLREARVSVVQAFTPYAETLGNELRQQGIDPARDLAIRLLVIGGELRTAEAKDTLADLWGGVAVREQYGTGELGMVAGECDAADGMHVSDDCIVEIVDPETGAPVNDPVLGGEIVVTDLWKRAQPIIRYRTGDITEWVQVAPCACGRRAPRLGRIVGRHSNFLRVKGLFVQPSQIGQVLESVGYRGQHRIIVERPGIEDELTVLVERPGTAGIAEDDVVGRLKTTIGITCKVQSVDGLPSTGEIVADRRDFT